MPGQQRGGREIRYRRNWRGSKRASADTIAWSGHRPPATGPAHLTAQHRDFVAQDQDLYVLGHGAVASSPSQPNTVTEIRYISRNSTTRDHGVITCTVETPGHGMSDGSWHGAGPAPVEKSWRLADLSMKWSTAVRRFCSVLDDERAEVIPHGVNADRFDALRPFEFVCASGIDALTATAFGGTLTHSDALTR